jgi:hypothetical protein
VVLGFQTTVAIGKREVFGDFGKNGTQFRAKSRRKCCPKPKPDILFAVLAQQRVDRTGVII